MRHEREDNLLRHSMQPDPRKLFLSFLHEMDQKVESYIETVSLLEDRSLMRRLKKAQKGKYITLEAFARKHGLK